MGERDTVQIEDRVIVSGPVPTDVTVKAEASPRRVRVVCGGVTVADSSSVLLVHETRHLPVYYFPAEDVRMDLLAPTGRTKEDPHKGDNLMLTLSVGGRVVEDAAWLIEKTSDAVPQLAGHVAFYWSKMDSWYEEDDEVYVHPRDPHHRVDVLHSSRHVQVVVLGEIVAESTRPRLLFETNLPTRYYLPAADVRPGVLVPSATTSQCPYKGVASYRSVRVGDMIAQDLAWFYRFPTPECLKIENLLCFFNEQVDAIIVDGVEQPKPLTPWTRPPKLVPVAG
jgi:uncharacterized protein (DUF427 family)